MTIVLSFKLLYLLLCFAGVLTFLNLEKIAYLFLLLIFIQSCCAVMWTGASTMVSCPLMLVNGPVLYLIYVKNKATPISLKTRLIHLLPFGCAALAGSPFHRLIIHPGNNLTFYDLTITLGGLSEIIYASFICSRLHDRYHDENSISIRLKQVGFLMIINGSFTILTRLNTIGVHLDSGFNIKALCYSTFLISAILIIKDMVLDMKTSINFSPDTPDRPTASKLLVHRPYQYSSLQLETLKTVEIRIHFFLTTEKIYLDPNITLDQFSEQIQIPKNHLSQAFNTYMNRGFYRIIAEYRIAHALEVLKNNKSLKIEALAYDCGFNSLSSFNRYFKEIVGVKPSIYIKEHDGDVSYTS